MKKSSGQAKLNISLQQKIILIVFGICLFIILLEAGLRAGGFIISSLQEYRNWRSIKKRGTYRIMCLGESTTVGQYPVQLEEILNQRNMGLKFSVIDKGVGGKNTSYILEYLPYNLNKYKPDMAVVMMGINDSGSHIPYEGTNNSKSVMFFKSFRVYKLARLLWLHALTKAGESGFCKGFDVDRSNFAQPEKAFKEAIETNPSEVNPYLDLGRFCNYFGKFTQAEEACKEAIETNPSEVNPYLNLGWLYIYQGRNIQAEETFKKAVAINPGSDKALLRLGWFYKDQGRYTEAEEVLQKALKVNPGKEEVFMVLGEIYMCQGKYAQAEKALKKSIEINPVNDTNYSLLSKLFEATGETESAKEYSKKANELKKECYSITIQNYQRVKEILDRRNIKLICVQYPMCSIEPLKKMLEGCEGVMFVDNEKIFQNAVMKEGYKEYFVDVFAGDFGHCTLKGNRLLAENVARVILEEYFNR